MILVTGSDGLVGCSLKKFLHEYIVHYTNSKECDLRDLSQVDMLFSQVSPTIVVHLAARVGGVYANLNNNLDFLLDNSKLNNNIIEMCRKYNVKLLINVLSTCIFPDKNITYPITSDQLHNGLPHQSNIGYSFSKRLLHISSNLLSDTTTTSVVNLTPTNLYGENDNYNLTNAHVIPALIHKVYLAKTSGTDLIIKGDGSAMRQFLYVDDLSNVIAYFIRYKAPKYTELIVAPPTKDEISIKTLLSIIVNKLEYTGTILYDTTYPNGQIKKTVDSNEINKYTHFHFTPLKNGLEKTIAFFCNNYDTIRK